MPNRKPRRRIVELSKEEKERRKPLPPDELVDAQQDAVHHDEGRPRSAVTTRAKSTPFPLAGKLGDTVVVPHTLAMLLDVEKTLSVELEMLRKERETSTIPMSGRDVHRFEKLTNILAKMDELKRRAQADEGEPMREATTEELQRILEGKD